MYYFMLVKFQSRLIKWCVRNLHLSTSFREAALQTEYYPVWGTCQEMKMDKVKRIIIVKYSKNHKIQRTPKTKKIKEKTKRCEKKKKKKMKN